MAAQICLLLVEDEPLVLLSTEDVVESGGYLAITAASGDEAIAVLELQAEELAGIITDIRMGAGPSGWDIARRARELRPGLPVVYTTGDCAHQWPMYGVPGSVVVQKPYAPAQLLTAISMLITEADTRGGA